MKNKRTKKQRELRRKIIGRSIFFITLFVTISLATSAVYAFGLSDGGCNIRYDHKHKYYRHVEEQKEEKGYMVRIGEGRGLEYKVFSEKDLTDDMNVVFEVITKTKVDVIEEIWSSEEEVVGFIKTNEVDVNYKKELSDTKNLLEEKQGIISSLSVSKAY